MGDADARGKVGLADELDTIDGVEIASPSPPPAPIAAKPPLTDYLDPVTVEKGHYKYSHEIASGGMGRVYAARDLRLGRAVAIKQLLPRNRDAARRFEREARITARLQHPAIIHVYEAGIWSSGERFYAMPQVIGRSLDKVVAERPSLEKRLGLVPNVIAVADALAYAHNENVIHRDLKPANVLVGAFGETVVIDWGLAKDLGTPTDPVESMQMRLRSDPEETNVGSIIGTPAYMPPEQARGESVDRRADVYSLGSLLYYVLVGAPPYAGKSSNDVLDQVKAGACRPIGAREPDAPKDLVAIVNKAMARDADNRYADAGELVSDLKRFQTGQLVAARSYTTRQLLWRWLRRYRVVVGISVGALVALAIVGAISISRILHEQQQQELRRTTLLEERGRSELLGGQAGRAIVYLAEAAKDGRPGGARGLLIADALRPFESQLASYPSSGDRDSVAFSADGNRVVTLDARIHVRANGVDQVLGAPGRSSQVLFAPDGRVLTVDDDHVVRVWSTTGTLDKELKGHTRVILDMHLSADGRSLATGSADGTARVWDLNAGGYHTASCGDGLPVYAVRMAPSGNYVVSATDDNVLCYWDAHNGAQLNLMRGHKGRISSIRWFPDPARRLVLTASADGNALLWDPFRGKPVIQPMSHDGRAITRAEFSSDGRSVVTAGADSLARLWTIPDEFPVDDPSLRAREQRRFAGHASGLTAAVFDATDERIATAGIDNKAKVWDAATGELLATFEHADVVSTISFAPDGQRLLTASTDRTARLWDLSTGVAKRPYEADAVVHAVAVSRDGSVAAARTDSRISIWGPGSDKPEILRNHAARVLAIAYSPDGRWLASGGEEAAAQVFDARSRAPVRVLDGHQRPIRWLVFSGDSTQLATAGDEGVVRVWSVATGTVTRMLRHSAPLLQLAMCA